MWKIKKHKAQSGQQELQVCIKVKELQYSYSTDSRSLDYQFKDSLQEIKRTNNFDATLMYKMKTTELRTAEVWKVDAKGDFKYKMFTLEYQHGKNNPFNF